MSDVEEDLFESLGIDMSPLTTTDKLWDILTDGTVKKVDNIIYWMRFEMSKFDFITSKNTRITKNVMQNGKHFDQSLSRVDYGRIIIEYYLDMYFLPWFIAREDFEPADRKSIVDKLVSYQPMRTVIEKMEA